MKRKNLKKWAALLCVALLQPSLIGYAAEEVGQEERIVLEETMENPAAFDETAEMPGDDVTIEDAGETVVDTGNEEETEAPDGSGEPDTETDESEEPDAEPDKPEKPKQPEEEIHYGWYQDAEKDWYYYNASGKKVSGWVYLNGAWYYLDGANEEKPGVMAADCKKKINGAYYFFDASGAMRTGWVQRPEGWYYAGRSGAMATGWQLLGAWYYLDADNEEYPGLMAGNCKMDIAGAYYFFDVSGAMRTGWVRRPEGWYYAGGSGAIAVGWQLVNGSWYYLDRDNEEYPGLMAANCEMNIEGATYFFSGSGSMYTGWVQRPEGWYFTNGSGAKVTGWQFVNGHWYYLDADNEEYPGLMAVNCKMKIGEHEYYFNQQGAMRSGWHKDGSDWYYYDPSGLIASGWRNVGGTWYYFDPANCNKMLCGGWQKINGTWYYLHSSGAMATNWLQIGGGWYFFAGDGAMRTGWQMIGGYWYYFYSANDPHGGSEGLMARNTTIDGWRLSASGAMLTEGEMQMSLKAQPYSSNTNYLILVDRSACKVGVFSGRCGNWGMINYWNCAPGKPSTPTVSGVFKVQSKGYYFDSGAARCYWYTQFYGNYLFHSVLYNKNGTLQDGRVGMQLSHGCVRLEIGNAKWIYDNIPAGTTVVVY